MVTVVRIRCSASTVNKERARKPPSNGETPRHRAAHRAYHDEGAVIGSKPSGIVRAPRAGKAGAGRPFGNAGMPSPRGRPPHTQRRLASRSTNLSSQVCRMAPCMRIRSTVPRTHWLSAVVSGSAKDS
ncbi:Uncharacterised protein [Mycobacteroides abscessus subsp. abscessus]|nr:Uncharacterised protein [Mycobacteroides abscessus subsp. abscessus]